MMREQRWYCALLGAQMKYTIEPETPENGPAKGCNFGRFCLLSRQALPAPFAPSAVIVCGTEANPVKCTFTQN